MWQQDGAHAIQVQVAPLCASSFRVPCLLCIILRQRPHCLAAMLSKVTKANSAANASAALPDQGALKLLPSKVM